jgi:hypothetical protein
MPGCVLRIGSKTTKVEVLIETSGFQPLVIYRKGRPRVPGGTSVSLGSGFNVAVSNADGTMEKQTRDAIRFLKRHAGRLELLRRCNNFGGMTLDFGLWNRAREDRSWASYRLPATLIELAGKHSIEIEISFYGSESDRPG